MGTETLSMSEINKAFWAKSPAEQRIAIAEDVIKQLSIKFIKAESGTYLGLRANKETSGKLDDFFAELRKEGVSCEVCGIGACFVSLVQLGNDIQAADASDSEFIRGYANIREYKLRTHLRKVFPPSQITLIETAFEVNRFCKDDEDDDTTAKEKDRAERFGNRYKTDERRLIGIMKNIIKNNGTFIP